MFKTSQARIMMALTELHVLQKTYGKDALMWWVRWRLFYISCSEFFGAKNGTASGVGHYLFKKR